LRPPAAALAASRGVLNPSVPHSLDHARASTVAISLRSSINRHNRLFQKLVRAHFRLRWKLRVAGDKELPLVFYNRSTITPSGVEFCRGKTSRRNRELPFSGFLKKNLPLDVFFRILYTERVSKKLAFFENF
jgi:hypothetical protein